MTRRTRRTAGQALLAFVCLLAARAEGQAPTSTAQAGSAAPVATQATVPGAATPRVAPQPGYQFHDQSVVGGFVVQRWVDASSPEVSPGGMCQCLTLVYQGTRAVLTLGQPDDITAIAVVPPTGRDINGDRLPEIVVSAWSGGAHCCYTTSAYSVGASVRPLLSLDTGDCGPGEFVDLDGDGILEFSTCDPGWGYLYCSFALSPFPPVVHVYDARRGEYRPATPRFARHFQDDLATSLAEARTHFATPDRDAMLDKCAVLQPALRLMYTGRIDEGRALIRALYRGADAAAFERDVTARLRASPLWTGR